MESSVAVVCAGLEEIGEYIVLIRCADELADRQPHLLCVPASEDVAEVAGRDGKVDLVAEF